jgi:hypothetical protein
MHWSLREFFAFADSSGGAFLWDAELTPAAGAKTTEISGMDLVLLCGVRLSRNEVCTSTGWRCSVMDRSSESRARRVVGLMR